MKIVDLENISWFPLLFLTGQQIPRKYQAHKNDVDTLKSIPRKHTKLDPQKISEHYPARKIFSPEISVKIVNVNVNAIKELQQGEIKIAQLV